jgi:hypothetical protein
MPIERRQRQTFSGGIGMVGSSRRRRAIIGRPLGSPVDGPLRGRRNPRPSMRDGGRQGETKSQARSARWSKAYLRTKEVIQADLNQKVRLSLSLEQGEAHVPAWGFVAGDDRITSKGVVTGIKAR